MQHHIKNSWRQGRRVSRGGFTLVEILVALAIFVLLLAIILVPLNMGMTMLHLGKAKADVQSSTQRVVDRMRGDLTKAIYVYPNDIVPSVTDQAPYYNLAPYFQIDPPEPCSATDTDRAPNLSRIDMLLPQITDGSVLTPVRPAYYLVTYYARRRDPSKPYQPIDNPIVLYRAQIPFRGDPTNPDDLIDNTGAAVAAAATDPSVTLNANVYSSRYTHLAACGSDSAAINPSDAWLVQNDDGEPNLEPLTDVAADAFTLYGSHVSLIPSGIGMVTGVNYKGYDANNNLVTGYTPPKSTFICADTNRDGVIDQVTLNVLLQKVDDMGAEPRGQDLTLPQVVDLPNVRSIAGLR